MGLGHLQGISPAIQTRLVISSVLLVVKPLIGVAKVWQLLIDGSGQPNGLSSRGLADVFGEKNETLVEASLYPSFQVACARVSPSMLVGGWLRQRTTCGI